MRRRKPSEVSRFRDGGSTEYYTGDNSEFSESEFRVTGYRFFSGRGSVYRYFWHRDRFTDHRFTDDTFR